MLVSCILTRLNKLKQPKKPYVAIILKQCCNNTTKLTLVICLYLL